MRPRWPTLAGRLATVLAGVSACAGDVGGVELAWAFYDRELRPVFPRGDHRDACDFVGRRGDSTRRYDLEVELSVLGPCADTEPIEACPELARGSFECGRFRGYLPELPADEDPYLMQVRVLVDPTDEAAFPAVPTCVAVPGPRERTVRPGHVTDLAVYQLILDATAFAGGGALSDRLDLDACAEVEP